MRRLIALLLLALPVACTNAQNESIEIPFALESSDELQVPTPGQPCYFTPVIQAGGFFKTGGSVDIDPNVNAAPQYELALQVENYLDQTTLTDSNGNPLSGPQRNDFHIQDVIVQYVATDPSLLGGLSANSFKGCPTAGVPCGKFLATGDVPAGGMQAATAIIVDTLSNDLIGTLQSNFTSGSGPALTQIILEITMEGVLGSGEPIVTGVFNFPLTVCFDCDRDPSKCPFGVQTPVPDNHGPCCASQDFGDTCTACGGAGQPCCALPSTLSCGQDSDCGSFYGSGFSTWSCVGGTCACSKDADCAATLGAGSKCAGGACSSTCTAGLTCQLQATLPIGVEACPSYPNVGAYLSVCAKPSG